MTKRIVLAAVFCAVSLYAAPALARTHATHAKVVVYQAPEMFSFNIFPGFGVKRCNVHSRFHNDPECVNRAD